MIKSVDVFWNDGTMTPFATSDVSIKENGTVFLLNKNRDVTTIIQPENVRWIDVHRS